MLVISQEIWPYPGGWLSFFLFCQDQANEDTAIVCKTGESFYARSIPTTAFVSSMVDEWGIPQVWWFQTCSVTLW
jgi:hypothetical protein